LSVQERGEPDPFEAFQFFDKQEAGKEDLALTFSHQMINSTFFNFPNQGNITQSQMRQQQDQKEIVANETQNGSVGHISGSSLVKKPSIMKSNSDQPSIQRIDPVLQDKNQNKNSFIEQQESKRVNQQQPDLIEEKFYGGTSSQVQQPQNLMDMNPNSQQNPDFQIQRQIQMMMQMQAQQNFRPPNAYGMFNSHGNISFMARPQGNVPNMMNGQIFPQFISNFNNQTNNISNQNMGKPHQNLNQKVPNFMSGQGNFNMGLQNQQMQNMPININQGLLMQENPNLYLQNNARGENYIHPHIQHMQQNISQKSQVKIQENKNAQVPDSGAQKNVDENQKKTFENEQIREDDNQINNAGNQNIKMQIDEYDLLFKKSIVEQVEETKSEVHFTITEEFGGWDSVFDVGNNFGIQNQIEQERKMKEQEEKTREKNISLTNTSLTTSNLKKFIFQEFSKSNYTQDHPNFLRYS